MTEQTERAEVEALARIVGRLIEADGNTKYYDLPGSGWTPGREIARAVLASDWLAADRAAAEARGAKAVLDAIEAEFGSNLAWSRHSVLAAARAAARGVEGGAR
jgi:hypothetical protein